MVNCSPPFSQLHGTAEDRAAAHRGMPALRKSFPAGNARSTALGLERIKPAVLPGAYVTNGKPSFLEPRCLEPPGKLQRLEIFCRLRAIRSSRPAAAFCLDTLSVARQRRPMRISDASAKLAPEHRTGTRSSLGNCTQAPKKLKEVPRMIKSRRSIRKLFPLRLMINPFRDMARHIATPGPRGKRSRCPG